MGSNETLTFVVGITIPIQTLSSLYSSARIPAIGTNRLLTRIDRRQLNVNSRLAVTTSLIVTATPSRGREAGSTTGHVVITREVRKKSRHSKRSHNDNNASYDADSKASYSTTNIGNTNERNIHHHNRRNRERMMEGNIDLDNPSPPRSQYYNVDNGFQSDSFPAQSQYSDDVAHDSPKRQADDQDDLMKLFLNNINSNTIIADDTNAYGARNPLSNASNKLLTVALRDPRQRRVNISKLTFLLGSHFDLLISFTVV